MKNAPCVRFASRISPKISENPDDSRNSRPPSDRLLRPWMIQNCIVGRSCPGSYVVRLRGASTSGFQVLRRRIVARIDRVLQERGFVIGPELTDIWVSLDDRIDQPSVAARDLANIDIADGIAEFIDFDGAAHRLSVAAAPRRHQRLLLFHLAV